MAKTGEKALTAKVLGLNRGHVVYCHDLRGSFAGAPMVCGAEDVRAVGTACVCEGAKECTFDISWR